MLVVLLLLPPPSKLPRGTERSAFNDGKGKSSVHLRRRLELDRFPGSMDGRPEGDDDGAGTSWLLLTESPAPASGRASEGVYDVTRARRADAKQGRPPPHKLTMKPGPPRLGPTRHDVERRAASAAFSPALSLLRPIIVAQSRKRLRPTRRWCSVRQHRRRAAGFECLIFNGALRPSPLPASARTSVASSVGRRWCSSARSQLRVGGLQPLRTHRRISSVLPASAEVWLL